MPRARRKAVIQRIQVQMGGRGEGRGTTVQCACYSGNGVLYIIPLCCR